MPIKQRTINHVHDTRLLLARAREFERRGAAAEALVAYDMAAALITGLPPGAFHSDLYRSKGILLREMGETTSAACLLKRSLDVAHYVLYANGVARSQHALAAVHLRRGDVVAARQLYGDASLNATAAGDQRLYSLVELSLGAVAEIQGDLEGARVRYQMSLRALRAIGDDEGMSWALYRIGLLHVGTANYDQASQALEQADEIANARGDKLMEARLALGRTALQLAAGSLDEAEAELARAITMTERRYERPLRAEALLLGGRLRHARGELERAASDLEEARKLAEQSEDALAIARTLTELGEVWQELGESERATETWEGAVAGFAGIGASHEAERLRQMLDTQLGGSSVRRSS